MQLPGRLRATTLGDLLGQAHRARATGTLELTDETRGRTHRVHLQSGKVTSVELDGASRRLAEVLKDQGDVDDTTVQRSLLRAMSSRRLLGEVLVKDFAISERVVGAALRKQLALRLASLESLADARVSFRVTVRPPREALVQSPLEAPEFLAGKRRARDRGVRTPSPPEGGTRSPDYHMLGVPEGADPAEVRRAFRKLARTLHPDLHPFASPEERRSLEQKLAQVTAAYQRVVA